MDFGLAFSSFNFLNQLEFKKMVFVAVVVVAAGCLVNCSNCLMQTGQVNLNSLSSQKMMVFKLYCFA